MKFGAQIGERDLLFSSEMARQKFYELKGKYVEITVDDRPSSEMRRYFEGAVVPAIFWQLPAAGWTNLREARDAIKYEFLPAWTRDTKGLRVRIARNTSDLSKEAFRAFLDKVRIWMWDNGMETPDPDEYKAWRDSAPEEGEEYPPLARLKATYQVQRAKLFPWENPVPGRSGKQSDH